MATSRNSVLLLLCLASLAFLCHVRGALPQTGDAKYIFPARLQSIARQKRYSPTLPCCLVSSCETIPINLENHEAYKCYKKEVCGNACKRGQVRKTSGLYSPRTPGYKIKSHYYMEKCVRDQCVNYRFDCARCPHPSKPVFSVYALRSDCISCYY